MEPVRPPRLRRGNVIGLISPASRPHSSERIEKSVRYLEGLGYRVKLGRHVDASHGFFAGTDSQRLDDLNAMIRDPLVHAIFALRGGNGCCRLLRQLDYRASRRTPKIIVGYSDLTFLQLALWRRARLVTFSGPMPAVELWEKPDPFTEDAFWSLLTSKAATRTLPMPPDQPPRALNPGLAQGRLLGGCASLVTSILGSPYQPDFRNGLLFLEDVREELHRIHRMFAHLGNAGILRRVSGLILGQFTDIPGESPTNAYGLREILDESLTDVAGPILCDVAYGHVPRKMTLPQGVLARIDASRGTIRLLESPVS